ncbi:MAG TPA: microcin ABC transporter permease [Alphaproteobacteria bacterium]|nr:microcin ABC transporter permease [Alphaproteobacteria bacterium]
MTKYVLRRLALIPLTLFGIMAVNFLFAQLAPGGPVEHIAAKLQNDPQSAKTAAMGAVSSKYRGAQGLDPALIKELEHQFGFDKPVLTRFALMMKNYALFDFGKSFYRDAGVTELIKEKMPVSVSLGLWTTLIIYLVSIPLGIAKAVHDGSKFDAVTGWAVIVGYAVPAFVFAMALIVLFCGGRYLHWFPLRGLTSDNWDELSSIGKIKDYFWHLAMPVASMTAGGFAGLTMLTKNSFLEEISKQYVLTARAKGLDEYKILYGHVFRNAMLIVIAGFPAVLVGMLFTGSVLIEVIFSLDGIGLLGFEAVLTRDYPVVFGTLYLFGLVGLVLNLVCDLTYHQVDPRIDFGGRTNA